MEKILTFNNSTEFEAYLALLKQEGKVVIFNVKKLFQSFNFNGDNSTHVISISDLTNADKILKDDTWVISFTIESDGSSFNDYGSTILASFSDPFNYNGFQMYDSKNGFFKFGVSSSIDTTIPHDSERIDVEITYSNGKIYLFMSNGTITYGTKGGYSDKYFSVNFTKDIDTLSYALPKGVNIKNLTLIIK